MKIVYQTLIIFLVLTLNACTSNEEVEEKNEEVAEQPLDYLSIGKEYALQTKSVLGQNLTQALGEGGSEHALSFCTTRAIPLTDSMAVVLNAKIKRVSDKPRNAKNQANQKELDFILNLKAKGENYQPVVEEMDGKMVGYYPILTNGMCLQCHGNTKSEITPGTMKIINKFYPNDLATGYKDNEIRGLFVVEMNKK